jgi:hypothetical protein
MNNMESVKAKVGEALNDTISLDKNSSINSIFQKEDKFDYSEILYFLHN